MPLLCYTHQRNNAPPFSQRSIWRVARITHTLLRYPSHTLKSGEGTPLALMTGYLSCHSPAEWFAQLPRCHLVMLPARHDNCRTYMAVSAQPVLKQWTCFNAMWLFVATDLMCEHVNVLLAELMCTALCMCVYT